MSVRVYKSWDWEHDRAAGPIEEGERVPESRAIVHLDYRGLPYRVIVKNPTNIMPVEASGERTFVYDYFYGTDRRLLEKRSLDGQFQVVVIIRYDYDDAQRMVTETSWYPGDLVGPQTRKRPF